MSVLELPGGYRLGMIELRAQLGTPDATDVEVAYFAEASRRLDLSHFRGEIALVPRWSSTMRRLVHRPEIALAGRRTIAARTGNLLGIEGPWWTGPREVDGSHIWVDVWDDLEPPHAAKVLVHVRGWTVPANGTLRWAEFAQYDKQGNLTPTWKSMPSHMLGVRAESLALRRGFSAAIAEAEDVIGQVADTEDDTDIPGDALDAGVTERPLSLVEASSPVTQVMRAHLHARTSYLAREHPEAAGRLRLWWADRFDGHPPKVADGDYSMGDAAWLGEQVERAMTVPYGTDNPPMGTDHDRPPSAVYDDDPEAFEAGATRYDPDDGEAP